MIDHRPRLTLWGDGEYMLSSEGADGTSTMLMVRPDGLFHGSTTTPAGLRELVLVEPNAEWLRWLVPDVETRLRVLRRELGAWGAHGTSTVRYEDGGQAQLSRGRDYDWHHWEATPTARCRVSTSGN